MDAQTLNAWTRFALQKGGIGSATALVDNPATDIEDLMFMAGETITVLRKLDDEHGAGGSAGPSEGDVWYLGYCEGVVGRFRGAHVQIAGKLKKPVLMRRSGVGAIRDSTLRPMDKDEAAVMPASQIPPGIPINAVESDEDRSAPLSSEHSDPRSVDSARRSDQDGGAGMRRGSDVVAMYQGLAELSPSDSFEDGLVRRAPSDEHRPPSGCATKASSHDAATTRTTSMNAPHSAVRALNAQMNRLGLSTPPLSDENHAREARQRQRSIDSDSTEDSETLLPWARNSTASSKSGPSTDRSFDKTANGQDLSAQTFKDQHGYTPTRNESGLHPSQLKGVNAGNSNEFPPSPISSAESKNLARGGAGAPAVRVTGHKGHTDSADTTTTEDSSEGIQRHPNTFSIYDIYGRDSVVMPNFDFRHANGKTGSRLAPNSPKVPERFLSRNGDTTQQSPGYQSQQGSPALRVPSQRRPVAAPPVSPINAMSSMRPPPGAPGNGLQTPPLAGVNRAQGNATVGDPFRPPPNLSALRKGPSFNHGSPGLTGPRQLPQQGSLGPDRRSGASVEETGMQRGVSADSRPIGSNLLARRMRESGARGGSTDASDGLRINVPGSGLAGPNSPLNGPPRPLGQQQNGMPSPGHPQMRTRASVEQALGSGHSIDFVRQGQPSPLPGGQGIASGLVPPPSHHPNAQSPSADPSGRSTSPFSNTSGGSGRSPRGAMNTSPQGGAHGPQVPAFPPKPSTGSPRPSLTLQMPNRNASPQPRSPRSAQPPPPMGRPHSGARSIDTSQLKFDMLGFVRGSCPPIPMPPDGAGEMERWRHIVNENDVPGSKKSRKVKKMVSGGIPQGSRSTVWPFLQQSFLRRRAGLFEELCKVSQSKKGKKGKEELYGQVEKDVEHAFPDHRLFIGEQRTGQADLEAVLKAYIHYNPAVGYVQGLNLVAGFFLTQFPAEDAFWQLCALLRDTHIEGYYAGEMKQLHVDGIVFGNLLQQMDPELASRLMDLGIEPIHFAPGWILPLFVRILPWPTLLRAWDMLFYEGPPWILRVALGIIRVLRDPLMDRRVCPGRNEALRILLHPPQAVLTPENVIPCALSVKLKDGDVRKLSRNASKVVRQTAFEPGNAPVADVSGQISAVSGNSSIPPDRQRSLGGSSSGHEGRSPSTAASQRAPHAIV